MTNPACSEQRKATTAPKSPGSPRRPAGIAAAISSSEPASAATRAVWWVPGWTLLTVTPSPATSVASTLRKPVTAARAVDEAMRFPIGWRAPAR